MGFKEFVQILEAGGLFGTQGVPYESGSRANPSPLRPTNCDPYLSKHCGGASATAGPAGGATPASRMKKMKKK